MAESNGAFSGTDGASGDPLASFFDEVKAIEVHDSKLTPKQQIDRLCRPGSTYANLNPFDVLQVTPQTPLEEIKKQFRRLSILVHPDKNPDDERAQKAFDALVKAWKVLENEEGYKRCMEIVEEATAATDKTISDKRKKLKKEGKSTKIEEDDPHKYQHAVNVMLMKMFADMERKRREQEIKNSHEKKRKHMEEEEAKQKEIEEKEWQKNFEASRTMRVDSWRTFQTKAGVAKVAKAATPAAATASTRPTPVTAKGFGFKPPKHKAEQRN